MMLNMKRALVWVSAALLASSAAPALAAKAPLVPSKDQLPPLRTDGAVKYRTFASNDSVATQYNVSSFPGVSNFSISSGIGMYGWNFIWRGQAVDSQRPLVVFFGSSASRCGDVTDPLCVLNQGVYEGWPWAVRQSSNFSQGLLSDAGFAVLSVISPWCINTTTRSVRNLDCSNPAGSHPLKHYRPNIVIDILNKAQAMFGFNTALVMSAGQSQGARGALRLGTAYPLRAVSITGGNLEKSSDFFMQSLPWQNGECGEGCLTLTNPNVNGTSCTWKTPQTLPLAKAFASSYVNIYASPGDSVANLTTMVEPTCKAINKAALAAGRPSTDPACVIQVQRTPKAASFDGPSHLGLMRYGYGLQDVNFLVRAMGGVPVTFPSSSGGGQAARRRRADGKRTHALPSGCGQHASTPCMETRETASPAL
ncbi:hypothetical protein OC834_004415 [Tilletia horrida]|nr:hypothetical protein OC834_004415 [Tilletia horrida]